MDGGEKPLADISDFEIQDFIHNTNFDQFINLIRGDDQTDDLLPPGFDFDLINSSFVNETQFDTPPENLFGDLNFDADTMIVDPSLADNAALISLGNEGSRVGEGESYNDGDDLSATMETSNERTKGRQKKKADRSKALISERRRRGGMKENLYALRSLVPNISKMDKASIVGDAVLYVQGLQAQAKKLRSEIADLEALLNSSEKHHEPVEISEDIQSAPTNPSASKKIIQMDAAQVEEIGFYVRVVCNKGRGVAASLYKAMESLTSFHVRGSNLTSVSDRYVSTFTLNGVKKGRKRLNVANLKVWITGALLDQGFEFLNSFTC